MTESQALGLLTPIWPAPADVAAAQTTRAPGLGRPPYQGFNLALHVGDDENQVLANRRLLQQQLHIPEIQWLNQVHGSRVLAVDGPVLEPAPDADACWTRQPGLALAIMTADCLPVLLCDRAGTLVAAAHAGWRGLVNGLLPALVAALPVPPGELLAWLGPAISAAHYQVGREVWAAVRAMHPVWAEQVLRPDATASEHWHLDLTLLARLQLADSGITGVYDSALRSGTHSRWYSYRRDGVTGRMASLVWLVPRS